MKARDVMTEPVISVEAEAPISTAIRLMLDRKISGLPVVDAAGNLVGVVSEGDFLRRAECGTQPTQPRWLEFLMGPGRLADHYVKANGRTVGEVMTGNVKTVDEATQLEDIVALMERNHIKRVPVLRGKKLIGIVTRTDLLRALARSLHPATSAPTSDTKIREAVLSGMKNESWAPLATVDVIVRSGVVTLTGFVLNEHQRGALKVLAENVPGVKLVRDHMVWLEPISGTTIDPDDLQQRRGVQHHH